MPAMLHDIVIIQFAKMLQNLNLCLDKAGAHADAKKFDATVLLGSRLAPDQFALLRQIQIACDTAKSGAAQLTGKDAPAHEDSEKTLPDAKARIAKVIEYLRTFSAKDFAGAETRRGEGFFTFAGFFLFATRFFLAAMPRRYYCSVPFIIT